MQNEGKAEEVTYAKGGEAQPIEELVNRDDEVVTDMLGLISSFISLRPRATVNH